MLLRTQQSLRVEISALSTAEGREGLNVTGLNVTSFISLDFFSWYAGNISRNRSECLPLVARAVIVVSSLHRAGHGWCTDGHLFLVKTRQNRWVKCFQCCFCVQTRVHFTTACYSETFAASACSVIYFNGFNRSSGRPVNRVTDAPRRQDGRVCDRGGRAVVRPERPGARWERHQNTAFVWQQSLIHPRTKRVTIVWAKDS